MTLESLTQEPLAHEDDALAVLSRHAQNASAFLALNTGNDFYRSPERDGVVAYRDLGRRYRLQIGGACSGPDDQQALWRDFLHASDEARRRVIAVQLMAPQARLAAATGFATNQIGTSYSIDLSAFSLRGNKFVKTRNMITRSRREGVIVLESGVDASNADDLADDLSRVDRAWLAAKGRHTRELRVLIGERTGQFQSSRRLFVAIQGGEVVAYVSYSPVFGERPGWLYDLTRRRPDAPPGVIEHVFAEAAERLGRDGAGWIHLGLTPFVGLDRVNEIDGAYSPALRGLLTWVGAHAGWLYPSAGQVAFKLKWRPHLITPEYVALPGSPRVRDALALARATNVL